jgi:hypothetical protein
MMAMLVHLIAGLVLFAGIHPSINRPDASWVEGLYDDGDADSLIYALAMGDHVFPPDDALQAPPVAHVLVFMGRMVLPGKGTLFARWYFTPTVRGPPLPLAVCSSPLPRLLEVQLRNVAPPTRLWQTDACLRAVRRSPALRRSSSTSNVSHDIPSGRERGTTEGRVRTGAGPR